MKLAVAAVILSLVHQLSVTVRPFTHTADSRMSSQTSVSYQFLAVKCVLLMR